MRKRIYISGPITKGCRNENFSQAAKAQIELMQAGWSTYNPMLSMANFASEECDWETWLECDESWVLVSDLVLRLPGASLGAERECEFARRHNIPVVGPAYFECLKELFPEETKSAYSQRDLLNLMRFQRARRREQGLPAFRETNAIVLNPLIAESLSTLDWSQVCQ